MTRGLRVEAELRIQPADDLPGQYAALTTWLNAERELRGRLHLRMSPIEDNELGGALDAVVVALGSGTGMALARALLQFVRNRRADITIVVTRGKQTVSVTASRVQQAEDLLAQVLRDTDGE